MWYLGYWENVLPLALDIQTKVMPTSVKRKNIQRFLKERLFLASSSTAGKNGKLLEIIFGDLKNHVSVQLPCFGLHAKRTDYFLELCFPLAFGLAVMTFFWCYGGRSGNGIRRWASCSVDQLAKTISLTMDGRERGANVAGERGDGMSQGSGREQVQLVRGN